MKNGSAKGMVVLSMVIFGTIGIFVRFIGLPSPVIAMTRGLVGGLFLLAVLFVRRRPLDITGIRRNLLKLCVSGAAIGVNWIALFESYRYTSVAVATLCYYMEPVYVTLLSPLILHEKLTPRKLICVLIALMGMIPVSGILAGTGAIDMTGICLALAAGALYALVVLINKKTTGVQPWSMTLVQLLIAGGVMVPFNFLTGSAAAAVPDAMQVLLLAVVAIGHTGVAYTLYFGGIQGVPAQLAAVMSYIDPALAVLLSAAILHESITVWTVIGAVMILGATLVSGIERTAGKREETN